MAKGGGVRKLKTARREGNQEWFGEGRRLKRDVYLLKKKCFN